MSTRRILLRATAAAALAIAAAAGPSARQAAKNPPAKPERQWATWVEPDFPFFSSVLDARRAGPRFAVTNLSPRAIVLNLGRDCWAAFDTDLLRIAAIWHGRGVTPRALAPGSYLAPDKKSPNGQTPAPEPDGTVWLANGVYPGWQTQADPAFLDPREPAPSAEEVGRGPLPEALGRFGAVRIEDNDAALEYDVAGTRVEERITVSRDAARIVRAFVLGPASAPRTLVLGTVADGVDVALADGSGQGAAPSGVTLDRQTDPAVPGAPAWIVRIAPHAQRLSFAVTLTNPAASLPRASAPRPHGRRWPQPAVTSVTRASGTSAYVVDDVALPLDNPWRRNVRPGDVQFLRDGTGVVVTIDGDVWLVRGLAGGERIEWRRFASGLHEPLTAAIRDDQIYVFDRNGIWRLRDSDGDGEADRHELFSNAFAQTADMREFPSTIRPAPGGEFVIAKGGQEATTIGKHNGSVLQISADGRKATVLGYGFRQPNVSVNPRTGLVLASDQQGNYVPSTPLHVVGDRQFYGFLSDKLPREVYPAPIAEPLTWIPHTANASAMSQVWLIGSRMGPLDGGLVHIGFNSPELFRVMLNEGGSRPQAAVVSITRAFDFPPLNGSVNPADGQLYLAGFQILGWGTTATRLGGLGRVRYTGAPSTLPRDLIPTRSGVLIRLDSPVDRAAAENPDNFSFATWHYKRTYQYGSPQLRADGTPGIDPLTPSRSYLSKDGRSVFVAIPGMKPVMQMRAAWSLKTTSGRAFQDIAYFTPYELPAFVPEREGFGALTVDLAPRAGINAAGATPVTAEEGRRLYQAYGCMACHAVESGGVAKLGPSWRGLYGSPRPYLNGTLSTVADEAYLRESMLEPAAKVVAGYERGEAGMPSYAGVLTDAQVQALIAFIKTLK